MVLVLDWDLYEMALCDLMLINICDDLSSYTTLTFKNKLYGGGTGDVVTIISPTYDSNNKGSIYFNGTTILAIGNKANRFAGRKILVMVSKNDPNKSRVLITRQDFDFFNLKT